MTHSPKSGALEFRLEDVVVIKTPNDCKWCERRVNSYVESVKEWQKSYDQALKRIEKLEAALLKYGSHATRCACLADTIDNEYDIPCTCGFSEALADDQGEET